MANIQKYLHISSKQPDKTARHLHNQHPNHTTISNILQAPFRTFFSQEVSLLSLRLKGNLTPNTTDYC